MERLVAENERTFVSRGVAVTLLLFSAVTGIMGMTLLQTYEMSLADYRRPVLYPALYSGGLNLFACPLCFVVGVATLKRLFFPLTLAIVFLLLASGITAFVTGGWLFGLLFGALQIVVSIAVLASLVSLKRKK